MRDQYLVCCPDCGTKNVKQIGAIPLTDCFAGRLTRKPIGGGWLWRCRECHLAFRWPMPDQTTLNAMYEEGSDEAWTYELTQRHDWFIFRRWLADILEEGSSVLDVGCWDGRFLENLGSRYLRFGVELHPEARERALQKGISLLGTNFNCLDTDVTFDCVTALDVIEHVTSPKKFLSDYAKLLRKGGIIIISTGNVDSFSFRFMGSRYWYCTIAEHMSFISPKWCECVAPSLGLKVKKMLCFPHGRTSVSQHILDVVKNTVYKASPHFFAWLRQRGFGDKDILRIPELVNHPPFWPSAKDHLAVLFLKE